MEPISTVLTGMALVKQSVDFIKGHIDTAKDIGEIFGHVDNLLNGEKQIQQTRFGSKSMLGQTKDAAQAVIDSKLAQEALDEMHILIDNRFGFGTWQEILDLRNKQLKEEKEAIAEAKRKRLKRKAEIQHQLMLFATGIGGTILFIVVIFGLIFFFG